MNVIVQVWLYFSYFSTKVSYTVKVHTVKVHTGINPTFVDVFITTVLYAIYTSTVHYTVKMNF